MTTDPEPTYVISVDADLCAASGVCARMAPDLFKLDDFADTAEPVSSIVLGEEMLAKVGEVAKHCPTWAIRWEAAEDPR